MEAELNGINNGSSNIIASIIPPAFFMRIAEGAGRGLAYLHRVCEPHIVHRDIKSSNILLTPTCEVVLLQVWE